MADQATRLKTIADNLEQSYQSLRLAGANIAGLLQVGKATCEEVRAYNMWATAIYNTQKGMLLTLRQHGETGVPAAPPTPLFFTWKGSGGTNIDCNTATKTLQGAMKAALRGASSASFLSTNEISIQTDDQHALAPENSPSFATLAALVQSREMAKQAGLGAVGVIIAIAGIAIAISVAIAAIMKYLEVSEVAESNTEQVREQSKAFAVYTAARLDCFRSCLGEGKTSEQCAPVCDRLVDKPSFFAPGSGGKWGALQWIGFTVVAGVGTVAALKLYQRHKEGRPLLELPDPPDYAEAP